LLEGSLYANSVTTSFDGRAIRVTVPAHVMTEWAASDQVSVETPPQAALHLLIEKDFQCLHGRGEQDRDAYLNPLMS
jgi:hypothetical protein